MEPRLVLAPVTRAALIPLVATLLLEAAAEAGTKSMAATEKEVGDEQGRV